MNRIRDNIRLAATCGAAGRLLDAGMWLHGMDSTEAATNALIGLYDQYPNPVEDAVIFFNVIDQ